MFLARALVLPGFTLGYSIAQALSIPVLDVVEKVFPDGELYLRIKQVEELKGEDALVVSTMYPAQLENFFKTLMMINASVNSGASRVIALVAYMPYARQDKVFLPGEPVSGCLVAKALKSAGASALVTVDVHSTRVLECFEGDTVNIVVSDALVEHALKYTVNPVVIAPDKGALERAAYAARMFNLDFDYLEKQRDRVTGEVSYVPREVSVQGRDVVIVDDIISTGGTIAEASRTLLRSGARSVLVAATHGLLVGDAVNRISSAGVKRIVLGDTLLTRYFHPLVEYVDISSRVSRTLRGVLGLP